MFENRVLRRAKRVKVTGEYRKFHIESLHELYFSPNIIVKRKKSLYTSGKALRYLAV
jgi:hypothetical protein